MDDCHNNKRDTAVAEKPADAAVAGPAIGDMETAQGGSRFIAFFSLLLGGGLRPAKAARLTEQTPLGVAFLIHAFYGMLIAATFLTYAAWAALPTYSRFRLEAIVETAVVYLGFDSVVSSYGITVAESVPLKLGLFAFWTELVVLAVALFLCAWGAKEERLRASWANALRQFWLHTPYIFFAVVGVVLLRSCLWNTYRIYWDRETPTKIMRLLLGNAYNCIDYGIFPFNISLRFWHHYSIDTICVLVDGIVATWLIWASLVRIGARAPCPKTELSPRCEGCGYNLTGLPAPGRCPECGLPFADSRSPDVRPGTIWQNERQRGSLRAWGRTAIGLLAKPSVFGKQMQREPQGSDHRRFFFVSLQFVAIAACFGTLFLYAATDGGCDDWYSPSFLAFRDWPLILSGGMAIAATLSIVSAALVTVMIASVVGVYYRIRRGQNMTAAAMQSACYASCVLPVLYLAVFQMLTLLIIRPLWFADFVASHPIIADNIGSVFAVGCAAVICMPLLYLSMRVTRTMLHANR